MQREDQPDPEIVAAVERIRARFGASGLRMTARLVAAEIAHTEAELEAAFAQAPDEPERPDDGSRAEA